MIVSIESHLDHSLSVAIIAHITKLFQDRNEFFIETIELPPELGMVPCNLHGPITGERPVSDAEALYRVRANRYWKSRVCYRDPVVVRTVTVIAGPDGDDPCVLYTAYGGPLAPRELDDPALAESRDAAALRPEADMSAGEEWRKAVKFWEEHALGI